MASTVGEWISGLEQGPAQPFYLVSGDRVLAEPEAVRLGEAIAERFGSEVEVHRRPGQLDTLLSDLKTYSLFGGGKVIVAVEAAILADGQAATGLLGEAARALPVDPTVDTPSAAERRAALLLMRALRLLQIDPYGGSVEKVLKSIPDEAFLGKKGKRGGGRSPAAGKVDRLRTDLAQLLELGRSADLVGQGESEVEQLADLVATGLPEGHTLILAESSVAEKHPVVVALAARGALAKVGGVSHDRRKGWTGLGAICSELERETGARLTADAVEELARRTLRKSAKGGWGDTAADPESSARFAAEYRKLAMLAEGGSIDASAVSSTVEDRGESDVWAILDAIGAGNGGEALDQVRRLLATADDVMAARLQLFALLANFCRQVTAIAGIARKQRLPSGERNYGLFKSRIAPALQGDLPGEGKNPLAGLHPFRLHRAYLAAARLPEDLLSSLPARVLQAELELKGETRSPDSALAALVTELARGKARPISPSARLVS